MDKQTTGIAHEEICFCICSNVQTAGLQAGEVLIANIYAEGAEAPKKLAAPNQACSVEG